MSHHHETDTKLLGFIVLAANAGHKNKANAKCWYRGLPKLKRNLTLNIALVEEYTKVQAIR